MKCLSAILLIFLSCLLYNSCRQEKGVNNVISQAEICMDLGRLDSAKTLLDSIKGKETLSEKSYGRLGLLFAQICDKKNEDMPFVMQMERVWNYFREHGTLDEKAKAQMYLGWSYEEEKMFDEAMLNYLSAAELAEKAKDYSLAGKIHIRVADLHDFEDRYEDALRLYKNAVENYLKAKDSLGYACALREVAWIEMKCNKLNDALDNNMKVFKLALEIGDSSLLSSITNRLGANYERMDSLEMSKKYLLQSIDYEEKGSAPTYLALGNIYLCQKKYRMAYDYIQKASDLKTSNEMFEGGVLFYYYLLHKEMGSPDIALNYYEQYVAFKDSLTDLQEKMNTIKVEKRYEQKQLLNTNNLLQNRFHKMIIISVILLLFIVFIFLFYQYRVALKDKGILKQQQKLQMNHSILLEKELMLKGLESNIQQIRENILKASDVWQIVLKRSQNIELAKKKPLTDKEWILLIEIVKATFVSFYENLHCKFLNLTNDEVRFCTLLKLGLNSQQLSILLNIQPTSVSHKRYRIMKKGGCENTNSTLDDLIAEM